MKYLKMLGLAAVAAAALMAFVGAGTASAETTLCKKTNGTECLKAGDEIVGHDIPGTEETSKPTLTGSLGDIACNSTIKGKLDTATTPSGTVKAADLGWTNCEGGSAETVTGGTIGVHHDEKEVGGEKHNGTVTIKEFVVKVIQAGVTCYYGGELQGTLTASETSPVLHVTTPVSKIDNATHDSSFFCPSSPVWHATYTVTTPLNVITTV